MSCHVAVASERHISPQAVKLENEALDDLHGFSHFLHSQYVTELQPGWKMDNKKQNTTNITTGNQ